MKKLLVLTLIFLSAIVNAAEFTVHHSPGGPSDKVTRILHKYMPGDHTVVNRPGGKGIIAVKHLLTSNSFMLASMTQIYVTNSLEATAYDPYNELEILAHVGVMPNVLVCNSLTNIKSITDIVKAHNLKFGVAGVGSSEHIATEVFLKHINKTHTIVPYSLGGSKSVFDLIGGHIDCMFANYPTVKEFVSNDRLTVIMSSHDLKLNIDTWQHLYNRPFPVQSALSIVVAKKLPKSIRDQILHDIKQAFKNKKLISELHDVGIFPNLSTSTDTLKLVLNNNTVTKQFIVDNKVVIK